MDDTRRADIARTVLGQQPGPVDPGASRRAEIFQAEPATGDEQPRMGPATVGRIGEEGHLHYTAIGNVVNLASRLCSSAEDSQILLDRIAADAVRSQVPLAELEPRSLKGFDQPVPVFAAVTGSVGRPARWGRSGRRPSYF